jgi:hypothetical protein
MVVVLSGATAANATPTASAVVWQGAIFITSITPECKGVWNINDWHTSVYRAKFPSSFNNDSEGLAIDTGRGAYLLQATNPSGSFQVLNMSIPTITTRINGRAKLATWPNPSNPFFSMTSKVVITSVGGLSGNIDASTQGFLLQGRVTNWDAIKGCTVGFSAGYVQRPD